MEIKIQKPKQGNKNKQKIEILPGLVSFVTPPTQSSMFKFSIDSKNQIEIKAPPQKSMLIIKEDK